MALQPCQAGWLAQSYTVMLSCPGLIYIPKQRCEFALFLNIQGIDGSSLMCAGNIETMWSLLFSMVGICTAYFTPNCHPRLIYFQHGPLFFDYTGHEIGAIWHLALHFAAQNVEPLYVYSCKLSLHATCNSPISEIPFVTNPLDVRYRIFPLPCGLGYMTPRALQPEYALLMYDSMTPVPRLE